MKLFSIHVVSSKCYGDAYKTIKSAAYHFPKSEFLEDRFSMTCMRRYIGYQREYIRLCGMIKSHNQGSEIMLCLRAGITFYAGAVVALLGVICTILSFLHDIQSWKVGLFLFAFGLFLCGQYFWEGKNQIDRLVNKLK